MKALTLIVHANVQQDLADALRALPQVRGFTFVPVEGHGAQTSQDDALSARDRVVGYVPRVRADVLLADRDVPVVIQAVRHTPGVGGIYWVVDVTEHGRL